MAQDFEEKHIYLEKKNQTMPEKAETKERKTISYTELNYFVELSELTPP